MASIIKKMLRTFFRPAGKLWHRIPAGVKAGSLLVLVSLLSLRFYYYPTAKYIQSVQDGGSALVNSIAFSMQTSGNTGGSVENKLESANAGQSDTDAGEKNGNESVTDKQNQTQDVGQSESAEQLIKNSLAGKRNLPIYSVDRQSTDEDGTVKKQVALSFDAAWGADDMIKILDLLDKYNIKVTFFMTGGWVESFPDMVKEIAARGHDLGNHSENHKQMSRISRKEQQTEIMNAHNRVKELTGVDMQLFRPPYGDYNNELIKTAYQCGYYPIQWSVDSLDWKDYGVKNIVTTVLDNKDLTNGSIILMHNGAKYTADALEQVITGLQEKGYEIVPVSQLIYKDHYHMDGTGKQIAN